MRTLRSGCHVSVMSAVEHAALAEPWRRLWNNDLTLTDQIIHEEFVAHAAPIVGGAEQSAHGREHLNEWIKGIHSLLRDLEFTIEVGPIVTDEFLVVRWRGRGIYAGGFPDVPTDAVGQPVTFTGTDTLRIVDGRIAEYWANADSLHFVQQIGLRTVPEASR